MRRTGLVLALVAAMVTVLVFTAPAFAVDPSKAPTIPDASNPAGPGGKNPETGADNPPPQDTVNPKIGGDPQAADGTIGELATDYTVHTTDVGAPAGHHIIDTLDDPDPQLEPLDLESPGDLVQFCRDFPAFCPEP
jgi:hypothetical protein